MHPRTASQGMNLTHQIAHTIRTRINRGELKPNDPIPTAREITAQWKCSGTTAQAAIAILRQEGLITGGRGKAPRVKVPPRRQRITLSAGWSQDQKDLVLRPRAERADLGAIEMTSGISIGATRSTHRYRKVAADDELAAEFGIAKGTTLVRRRYEMRDRETDVRLSFSTSWIPLHLIASYPPLLDDSNEPWPGGHQHQLYTVGIEVGAIRRSLTSLLPTPEQAAPWAMSPGTPMLCIRSRTLDTAGRVVELSDAHYPADRTEVTMLEQLDPWPTDHPRFDQEMGDA